MSNHSIRRTVLMVAVLYMCAGIARGQDASLAVVLAESTIPEDGVLAGEAILTNTAKLGTFRGPSLDELYGELSYEVVSPQGKTVVISQWAQKMSSFYESGTLSLAPGMCRKHPILLVVNEGRFLFHDRGHYKLRAKYSMAFTRPELNKVIYSEWAAIAVVHGGSGRAAYVAAAERAGVSNYAFDSAGPAMEFVRRINEFHDYAREVAKYAIFKLEYVIEEQRVLATSLAQQYGFGVEMWACRNRLAALPNAGTLRADDVPEWVLYDF